MNTTDFEKTFSPDLQESLSNAR